MPGPLPKRSIERRRRNVSSDVDTVVVTGAVDVPPVPTGLHPIARRLYRSMTLSGQAVYFEPSDWEAARFAAEVITNMLWYPRRRGKDGTILRDKTGHPFPRRERARISAELLAVTWKMLTDLLVTEGARRRARIEIDRQRSAGERGIDHLDSYRDLGATEPHDDGDGE